MEQQGQFSILGVNRQGQTGEISHTRKQIGQGGRQGNPKPEDGVNQANKSDTGQARESPGPRKQASRVKTGRSGKTRNVECGKLWRNTRDDLATESEGKWAGVYTNKGTSCR